MVNNEGKLPLELLRNVSWGHMAPLLRCCPVALSRLNIPVGTLCQCIGKTGTKGNLKYYAYYLEGDAELV
jgi:hypothetical protein